MEAGILQFLCLWKVIYKRCDMKFRDVEKILSREGIPCHTYEQKEYDSSYTIEKSIGIGGWAEIFLVKPKENNTKVVHKNFKQNSPNLKHFSLDIQIQMQLKEIRALYKLKHLDCIVKLHKAIVIKSEENIEKLIIEEEYVEGNTLNKIELQSEEEKIKIAREIIKSIFCVHEQELIHRDLSRGNFMVAAQNLVKVIDFGAVKLDTDDQFLPIPKGTEGTLSPEGYWNNIIINRLNANNVSLEELTLLKKFKDTITQNLQDYEDASSIVPEEAIQDWHKQRIPWGKKCDIFSLGVILGQLFFGIDSLKFSSTINKKDIKLGWQEINFDFLLGDYELTIISQAGKNEFLLKLLKKMCSYKPKDRPDIKKVKEEFDKIYPQDSINNAANAGRTFKILNLWKNILLPSSPVKDIFNLKQKEIALSFDLGASSLKLAYKLGKKEHPVPFFLDYRIKTLVFSQKAKDFLEFNYLNTIPTVFYMKNDGTLVVADQAIADFVDNNDLIVDKNLKLSLLNNAGDKKIETHNNPDNICYKDVLKAILEYSKTFIDQLLSKKGYSLKYIVFSYPIYGEKYKEYCILFRNILNELFPLGFENIYEIDEASATLAHLLKYPEKIKKIYKNTTLALSMGSLSFEGALLEPDINDENVETECVYHHYSFNEDKIVGGDKCTKIIKEFLETEFHELENKILAAEIIKQNLSDQYARAMGDSATWNG